VGRTIEYLAQLSTRALFADVSVVRGILTASREYVQGHGASDSAAGKRPKGLPGEKVGSLNAGDLWDCIYTALAEGYSMRGKIKRTGKQLIKTPHNLALNGKRDLGKKGKGERNDEFWGIEKAGLS